MSGHVAVRGFESEEREGVGLGVEEVEEGWGGESGIKGFADTLCGSNLVERKVAEDLVDCILG